MKLALAVTVAVLVLGLSPGRFAFPVAEAAPLQIQQISSDPYTNTTSQHATQVEPDSFAFGNTVVTAFQSGRFTDGGSTNIGWATSTDGGTTWTNGFLPSLTVFSTPAGTYDRASDPSVAYDSTHNVWLISVLALSGATPPLTSAIIVSRSSNGISWSSPVVVAPSIGSLAHDKEWIVCDNGAASAFEGRCYVSYSDLAVGGTATRTSTDGGVSWGAAIRSADPGAAGIGAQPVVQPDGRLVIVEWNPSSGMISFISTDGGASFGSANGVAAVSWHGAPGVRDIPIPSVEVDGSGKIYAVWADCSFRAGCAADDLVLSTSANGTTWTAPSRIPIDKVTSGVEHVIPALAVDPTTSGTQARLAVTYYFQPSASCAIATCLLNVGFISSGNGGARWSKPKQLNATPMPLSWLADTNIGRMVGDYIATSFVTGGYAVPVFAAANAPVGSSFRESTYSAAIRVR